VAVNYLSEALVPAVSLTFKSKLAIVAEDDNVAVAQAGS
jgi:hypothetical protein